MNSDYINKEEETYYKYFEFKHGSAIIDTEIPNYKIRYIDLLIKQKCEKFYNGGVYIYQSVFGSGTEIKKNLSDGFEELSKFKAENIFTSPNDLNKKNLEEDDIKESTNLDLDELFETKYELKTLTLIKEKYKDMFQEFPNNIAIFLCDSLKKIKLDSKNYVRLETETFQTLPKKLFDTLLTIYTKRHFMLLGLTNSVFNYDVNPLRNKLVEDVIHTIFTVIKSDYNEDFDLTQASVTSDQFVNIASHFRQYSENKATKFLLNMNKIGPSAMIMLSNILYMNKHIEELDMSQNPGIKDNPELFLLYPKVYKDVEFSLRKLNLATVPFGPNGGKFIADILKICPDLIFLNIQKTELAEGFVSIPVALQELQIQNRSSLLILIANQNKITSKSYRELGEALASKYSTLETISLIDNNMNNAGGAHFFDCMKMNQSVRELILNKCSLSSDYGIEAKINQMIMANRFLYKIDLFDNKLSNAELMMKNLLATRNMKYEHAPRANGTSLNLDITKVSLVPLEENIVKLLKDKVKVTPQQIKSALNEDFTQRVSFYNRTITTIEKKDEEYEHKLESFDQSLNNVEFRPNDVLTDLISVHSDMRVLDLTQNKLIDSDKDNKSHIAKMNENIKTSDNYLKFIY